MLLLPGAQLRSRRVAPCARDPCQPLGHLAERHRGPGHPSDRRGRTSISCSTRRGDDLSAENAARHREDHHRRHLVARRLSRPAHGLRAIATTTRGVAQLPDVVSFRTGVELTVALGGRTSQDPPHQRRHLVPGATGSPSGEPGPLGPLDQVGTVTGGSIRRTSSCVPPSSPNGTAGR
jgi:hypothetical protein